YCVWSTRSNDGLPVGVGKQGRFEGPEPGVTVAGAAGLLTRDHRVVSFDWNGLWGRLQPVHRESLRDPVGYEFCVYLTGSNNVWKFDFFVPRMCESVSHGYGGFQSRARCSERLVECLHARRNLYDVAYFSKRQLLQCLAVVSILFALDTFEKRCVNIEFHSIAKTYLGP